MPVGTFIATDSSPCVDKVGKGCGACCVAPSITTPIPGMPDGKPSGVRCVQLDSNDLCKLFGKSERPKVCLDFDVDIDICFNNKEHAYTYLIELENLTG
ncbi:YkgJ family cysteine cluster protein [Pseudoalteromonas sp. XMcav11-Q]|uniref:YkgJ family cysteine cluster protein n=1 Tax=Pseudoalteromonas sp. XMcav11-Q TaxID=3136665 RepID=UPI0032C3E850